MTRRTKFPCRHRGCAALVDGPGYCDRHKTEATNWRPDRERGSRHARGYGAAWERLRKAILARDDGLCQPCKRQGRVTVARHVDHITPKARGGTDDPKNLEAICVECHRTKTAREGRGGSNL
jgi:5-methylcytosine-specific restriction protein A